MDKQQANLLIGKNPLKELLTRDPSRIEAVYYSAKDPAADTAKLIAALTSAGVKLVKKTGSELEALGGPGNQGFVALLKPRKFGKAKESINQNQEGPALVVMLDRIYDPHNLGTILRACECYGANAVVLSSNRGSPMTPSAVKASVGASELIEVIQESNLAQSLELFKEAGFWVIAADGSPEAQEITEFKFPDRAVIILGSEGEGVQSLLLKLADFIIKIKMYGQIDSLNVSQATAVMLHSYRLQHK